MDGVVKSLVDGLGRIAAAGRLKRLHVGVNFV